MGGLREEDVEIPACRQVEGGAGFEPTTFCCAADALPKELTTRMPPRWRRSLAGLCFSHKPFIGLFEYDRRFFLVNAADNHALGIIEKDFEESRGIAVGFQNDPLPHGHFFFLCHQPHIYRAIAALLARPFIRGMFLRTELGLL